MFSKFYYYTNINHTNRVSNLLLYNITLLSIIIRSGIDRLSHLITLISITYAIEIFFDKIKFT